MCWLSVKKRIITPKYCVVFSPRLKSAGSCIVILLTLSLKRNRCLSCKSGRVSHRGAACCVLDEKGVTMRDEKSKINEINQMNDLSCLPKDVQKCVLFPYLNPQSLLSLAICSKALYQVMKQSVAYWEARLLALGCDQKELNKIPQFSVTAYQRLCFQLERFPLLKFFASEEAWQLCCLSGDISAMEQVHRAGWLTGQTISDHGRYGGNGKNALHYAACGGSIEAMQFAINTLGIAAQGVDRAGMNALHYAAEGGSVEAMQFAVEKLNILANSTDVFGMNALHYAAEGGSPKAMEFAVHTLHIPAESVSTESTVPDK